MVCKKVGEMIRILKILSQSMPSYFCTNCQPATAYHCHLMWHFRTASDSSKLECLQERALQLAYNTSKAKSITWQNKRLQEIVTLGPVPSKMIKFNPELS